MVMITPQRYPAPKGEPRPKGREARHRRHHGVLIVIISLVILCFILGGPELVSGQARDTQVKFTRVRHTREENKDVIRVGLTSNLPAGTILNCQIYGLVFCLGKKTEEKLIHSYLVEVEPGRQVIAKVKDFPWSLPPAIYVVKVQLAFQQRREIKSRLRPEMLGQTLTQQVLVVNTLVHLLRIHGEHLARLEYIYVLFAELSNTLDQLSQPDYTASLDAVANRIRQTLSETVPFSSPNYPGLYRLSYERALKIGQGLLDQIDLLKRSLKPPAKSGHQHDFETLDPPVKKEALKQNTADLANPAQEKLLDEAVFDLLVSLNHCKENMKSAYDQSNRFTARERAWAQRQAAFQSHLAQFDRYFKFFQEKIPLEKFTAQYENISAYRTLLNKLLETYSALIKEGPTETLQKTLKQTLEAIERIF